MKLDRRLLLRGAVAGGGLAALQGLMPAWAQTGSPGLRSDLPTLTGPNIDLTIGQTPFTVNGRTATATTINGVLPAPVLRLREGQNVRLAVTNTLDEDTSIHWHGILLPFQMDGVPGISFPGIKPRETFVYEFPIRQSGTFWYHSHSGLQEALGHYGPIVIDPAGADPVAYDREHVLVLSDWSFMHPHEILDKLKKSPGYFNRQRTTLAGLIDGSDRMSLEERRMWGSMRMDPRDILDVNGTTYTYLINGHGPQENWTGLFRPGERVRLRIINASAMSIFNVRIPGLPMTVASIRGQIAGAIQLIVQLSRQSDGKRKITSIAEVTGLEGDIIQIDTMLAGIPGMTSVQLVKGDQTFDVICSLMRLTMSISDVSSCWTTCSRLSLSSRKLVCTSRTCPRSTRPIRWVGRIRGHI